VLFVYLVLVSVGTLGVDDTLSKKTKLEIQLGNFRIYISCSRVHGTMFLVIGYYVST
jgi:hypothetical protein